MCALLFMYTVFNVDDVNLYLVPLYSLPYACELREYEI